MHPRLADCERNASGSGCRGAVELARGDRHSTGSGRSVSTVYAPRGCKASRGPVRDRYPLTRVSIAVHATFQAFPSSEYSRVKSSLSDPSPFTVARTW